MSTPMDALLDAVRDTLRTGLTLSALECDVCPDGKPQPDAGQRFFSVSPGNIRNQGRNCLDEYYSFKVTVTVRTGMTPRDRVRDGGVWTLAMQARAQINMSTAVVAAAAAADPTFVITEFPHFDAATYLGPQGPDWFWAEGAEQAPTGIAVELAFSGVRRIQYIESEEE